MWSKDEQVKREAREVVDMIANCRGGQPSIFQAVKQKCRTPALLQYQLCKIIKDETTVSPTEGLDLWMTITRLVKENIVEWAQDRLYYWIEIPRVTKHTFCNVFLSNGQKLLFSPEHGRMASVMMCYLIYYCQDQMEKCQKTFDLFGVLFTRRGNNVESPLKMLDACLNGFHFNNPLREEIAGDRQRPPLSLKLWARFTVRALNFTGDFVNTYERKNSRRLFVGSYILPLALFDPLIYRYHTRDSLKLNIIKVSLMSAKFFNKAFPERIQDVDNELGPQIKHAVIPPNFST